MISVLESFLEAINPICKSLSAQKPIVETKGPGFSTDYFAILASKCRQIVKQFVPLTEEISKHGLCKHVPAKPSRRFSMALARDSLFAEGSLSLTLREASIDIIE